MSLDWRKMPSLSSLRALDATARSGSFAEAGRSLNVTHAAIAQQVRSLEKDLGVKLVVRAGRTIRLTEAGERLAFALASGFSAIAEGVEELQRKEARRGLRVTTTTFVADKVVLPRLAEFWARNPGVEVALTPNRVISDIARDGFDLAIRGGWGNWPGLDVELLVQSRVLAVGAPSLVGDAKRDLADLPWIWVANNDWERAILEAAGLDLNVLKRVELGDPQLELPAVREGLGMTIAPEVILRGDLASGRLVEVPLPGDPTFGYYAVTPKGPRHASVDSFIAWLKTIF